MKIKNDLVSIKIGKKQYDFKNLILDTYLQRFIKGQLDKNTINNILYGKNLIYCMLKFDTPLQNINSNSVIYNQEFDAALAIGCKYEQTISEKQIIIEYTYNSKDILDYSDGSIKDISNFYGRKITALGFNNTFREYDEENEMSKLPVLAVLNTENYNIYLQENQELAITRKDIITTDALFYSNNKDKIQGPAHLVPFGIPEITQNKKNYYSAAHGILYSIGLSSYTDYIDKEFIIGQDIEVEENGTELNIKGLENYLATDNSLFPSNNIYPSAGLYPIKTNYKYVILKYKIWQNVHSGDFNNVITTPTDTGYYYYQAIPIDKFGELDLKIKYERG